jgi:hypothetical protein
MELTQYERSEKCATGILFLRVEAIFFLFCAQIYAIRFLQGLAESSTFVGTHYILGS